MPSKPRVRRDKEWDSMRQKINYYLKVNKGEFVEADDYVKGFNTFFNVMSMRWTKTHTLIRGHTHFAVRCFSALLEEPEKLETVLSSLSSVLGHLTVDNIREMSKKNGNRSSRSVRIGNKSSIKRVRVSPHNADHISGKKYRSKIREANNGLLPRDPGTCVTKNPTVKSASRQLISMYETKRKVQGKPVFISDSDSNKYEEEMRRQIAYFGNKSVRGTLSITAGGKLVSRGIARTPLLAAKHAASIASNSLITLLPGGGAEVTLSQKPPSLEQDINYKLEEFTENIDTQLPPFEDDSDIDIVSFLSGIEASRYNTFQQEPSAGNTDFLNCDLFLEDKDKIASYDQLSLITNQL